MFASLKKKMIKAKETMKRFADNHRRDISFKVGDWVLVKLRPHRQTSVKGDPYSLATAFKGVELPPTTVNDYPIISLSHS